MKFDPSALSNLYPQIDTHLEVEFSLDGVNYPLEEFNIDYIQEVDFKGQPQHEVKGGKILLVLKQLPDNNLFDWAKRSNKTKNGTVSFKSAVTGTILKVDFFNGHCIRLSTGVMDGKGTRTSLFISSEKITMNGISHDNKWRSEA